MSDKEFSLARPIHEKKACCEKFNFLRLIDVKNTAILSALLLVWIVAFIILVRHVFLSHSDTQNAAYNVIYITNETSRLAEERWMLEGGPSPQDRWRQEQEAKKREEEQQRIILADILRDIFPAPAAFSNPVVDSCPNRHKIDRIAAEQNTADMKGLEGIYDWQDEKVDVSIQKGIENLADQYAIESETLKACSLRMVRLYCMAEDTIGFTGIWIILSLGGLVICELIRWLFIGFFHYLANRLV
ncbi:MAG: hypothetical protein JW837_15560 [Sedimentisphaerales bacterium]|nr:hypothetical protein [Sedimentisphaerales bacterium]